MNLPEVTGLISSISVHQSQTTWHLCPHWPQSNHCSVQGLSRWHHHSPSDSGSKPQSHLFLSTQYKIHQQILSSLPSKDIPKSPNSCFLCCYHDGQSHHHLLTHLLHLLLLLIGSSPCSSSQSATFKA